ncbi:MULTISPECIES: FAD/NAD(P)-binding protein [unclassified Priestia]|uniref:FAD/NAD(P)-binding protein n=1 Tax=unclassified Priestia TaxID=2800374 RepID=UPI00366E8049
MSHKKKIAIIGAGVSGICSFNYLVKNTDIPDLNLHITLYDRSAMVGPGVPYQNDHDVLLLNRQSKQMSVYSEIPDDFWNWYKKKTEVHFPSDEFLPRRFFGQYLKESFESSVKLAKEKKIYVDIKFDEVSNIIKKPNEKYSVISAMDENEYDYVILCLGHTKFADYYNLKENERFIYTPYPLEQSLSSIKNDSSIGILGSSLTAVDICLVLQEAGHKGKIHMLSRSGTLPAVRGEIQPFKLKFLTEESLQKILANKKEIQLKEIINMLNKECKEVGLNLKNMLLRGKNKLTPVQSIKHDMANLNDLGLWQSILVATNEVIEKYWYYLKEEDKVTYLKKYERLFMSKRNPMPINNAQKILELLNDDLLDIKRGVGKIQFYNEKFHVDFKNDDQEEYDWIVNAVGSTKHLSEPYRDNLLNNLIDSGEVKINKYGGLEVDFNSGSIIDITGKINERLKALGHITCGTYYFTSSVEMISKHAKIISQDLIKQINKDINNTLVCI